MAGAGRWATASRRASDPLLLGCVAWTVLAYGVFAVLAGHAAGQVRAYWVFQPPLDLALTVCSWRVARLATGPIRRFWRVLTAVGVLFTVGDGCQTVLTFRPGNWSTTGGTVQTVCFGLALTAVLVAMLAHPHPDRSGRERLAFWLDSATVLVAGAVAAWCLVSSPDRYTRPDALAGLAATGVCVTAAFAAVKMMLSGNAPMHKAAALPMIGAAVVMSAGMFLPADDTPAAYLVRFLPSLLIVVGARVQVLLAGADPDAFGDRRRKPYSLLPYAAMAVAFAMLVAILPGGVDARLWGVVAGLALICALVAARQLVAFHDNAALIARLREHETLLRHQAHFDGLTGLANRTYFHERVAAALTAPGAVAVLLVDLDGFKAVNDTMGHAAGDTLLRSVADKLRGAVRGADLVARLGGDEFALLLPDCPAGEGERTADRILAALAVPVPVDGVPLRAAASIGVAEAVPGTDVDTLLRDADLAMYVAKHGGKGRWSRHRPGMTPAAR